MFHRYVGGSKSNAFSLFPWKLQQLQRAREHYLGEQILSYQTILQYSHHHYLWFFFFAINEQEPPHGACENLHQNRLLVGRFNL